MAVEFVNLKEAMARGDVSVSSTPFSSSSNSLSYKVTGGNMRGTVVTVGIPDIGIRGYGFSKATATIPFPQQHHGATRTCVLIDDEGSDSGVWAYENGKFIGPYSVQALSGGLISYFEETDSFIEDSFSGLTISNIDDVYYMWDYETDLEYASRKNNLLTLGDVGFSNAGNENIEYWNGYNFVIQGGFAFFDRVKAEKYLKTGEGGPNDPGTDPSDDDSGIGDWEGTENPTGDPLPDTEFTAISNDPILTSTLLLSGANMRAIGNILYRDSSSSLWTQIFDGLSQQYGEQPLSFIVDCFYIPLDPTIFISSTNKTTTNFGITSVDIGSHKVVTGTHIATIGRTYIAPGFNDFRDLMSTNYYINLPYAGIYALDIERYYKKYLTVKASFDIRTGTIKYYLLISNTDSGAGFIADMYEGSVRMNIPLMSTDTYQAAREKLSSTVALAGAAAGLATGNPFAVGSVVAGAGGIMNSALDLAKEPNKHSSGNFSSASGLVDTKQVYLIIEQTEISYPNALKSTYGLPDNRVDKIGSMSGFVQVDDIILKSSARESLKEKAIAALKEGVFV